MYSDADLDAAVTAGVIPASAAAALREHVEASRGNSVVDEEHFRLLTGFNDIFVAIAAIILLVAISWIGRSLAPRLGDSGPSLWSGALVAAAAWGLAEFFTRKRRMALPSILLLLAFVGGVFATAGVALALAIGEDSLRNTEQLVALLAAGAAAVAAAAAWLHWRRFHVPITVAAGAAAVVGLALSLIASALGDFEGKRELLLGSALALGVGVFLFAMHWDASDPRRLTRRSDVAFWLHLLAAPLIVHPVFTLLGLNSGEASVGEGVLAVGLYILLGLTALAIDRRALLVSALAYVLWALSDLFERFGAVELNFALTAFVIGSALLLLSAFWQPIRRRVVSGLPEPLQTRLPVVERSAPLPAAT